MKLQKIVKWAKEKGLNINTDNQKFGFLDITVVTNGVVDSTTIEFRNGKLEVYNFDWMNPVEKFKTQNDIIKFFEVYFETEVEEVEEVEIDVTELTEEQLEELIEKELNEIEVLNYNKGRELKQEYIQEILNATLKQWFLEEVTGIRKKLSNPETAITTISNENLTDFERQTVFNGLLTYNSLDDNYKLVITNENNNYMTILNKNGASIESVVSGKIPKDIQRHFLENARTNIKLHNRYEVA